jgi:Protein of unknown function (DUF2721)
MFPDIGTSGIAHAIQLALAPVFLLSAIGAMLAVMTNRLSRIVDRARGLEAQVAKKSDDAEDFKRVVDKRAELVLVAQRARLVSWAIALCTTTALLIASVVATLFLGAFLGFEAAVPIALLFIIAMLSMIAALSLFLREVFLSTANLRFNGATLRELSRDKGKPGV